MIAGIVSADMNGVRSLPPMLRRNCLPLLVLAAALLTAAPTWADGPAVRRPQHRLQPAPPPWDHAWLDGRTFYEIFLRSFADSDGDGIGDLSGLIDHLDHLNDGDPATTDDLGVGGIWLMPIFASPSYHGYDTTDYETVNPDYGNLDDFARLVEEAHRRGIRVILDLVLNHTSVEHPWFVESASEPASPRRDWYAWRTTNPGWNPPWGGTAPTWHANPLGSGFYYGVFWSGMPDLNYIHPPVLAEAERLARLWLGRGADGFRLDAVRYLVETGPGPRQQDTPETHAVWRRFAADLRRARPDAMLVGEAWADAATIATYFGSTATVTEGDELPQSFDFPLAEAVLQGVGGGNVAPILAALAEDAAAYPAGVRWTPFLSNHDQTRTATRLGGVPGRLRAAASVLLALPGVPFMYYGEEVGLANGAGSGDEAKRTPMPWDDTAGGGFTTGTPWYPFSAGRDTANVADQVHDSRSLLAHYRSLIQLRSAEPALGSGRLVPLTSGNSAVLAFVRETDDEIVVVTVNLGGGLQVAGPLAVPGQPVVELYGDGFPGPPSGLPGRWSLTLPPYATAIWRFTPAAGAKPAGLASSLR